jgi:putative phosphoesterase
MKWLIASDIHGSLTYCEALLRAFEAEQADRLLLLGDLLYHGPRNDLPDGYAPKAVISLLNARRNDIVCVRGNSDSELDQMLLDFPILAGYAILSVGKRMIFATHGHKFNEKNLPPLHKGDILLAGHTHVCACREHENFVYMNPGSVSIPKEDTPRAYMTLEDGLFLWKNLSGEIFRSYQI